MARSWHSSGGRSPVNPRRARQAFGAFTLSLLVLGAAGCGSSEYELAWSVRRGRVGEFAADGNEVFTIGARLTAMDAATGRTRRSVSLPADLGNITIGQLGPGAMVAGDALVFGWYDFVGETGTVFCFDTTSLAMRWQWQIHWPWSERSLRPSIAVTADDTHVYAAAIGKAVDNLFAFRLADGTLRWSRSVETFPAESALALGGGRLIVRSQLWARATDRHEQLDAIRVEDGHRMWRTWLTGEAKYHLGGPLIRDGAIYTTTRAGMTGGHLFVVRLSDGHTSREDIRTSGAPFAAHRHVIYFGGGPPLAYDVQSRRTVWRATLGYPEDAMPPMVAGGAIDIDHNRIFTGDSQRFVYVLAADTGALQTRLRLDTYPRYELLSPLKALYGSYGVRRLEMHRGRLLVGTGDSSLFVFQRAR